MQSKSGDNGVHVRRGSPSQHRRWYRGKVEESAGPSSRPESECLCFIFRAVPRFGARSHLAALSRRGLPKRSTHHSRKQTFALSAVLTRPHTVRCPAPLVHDAAKFGKAQRQRTGAAHCTPLATFTHSRGNNAGSSSLDQSWSSANAHGVGFYSYQAVIQWNRNTDMEPEASNHPTETLHHRSFSIGRPMTRADRFRKSPSLVNSPSRGIP